MSLSSDSLHRWRLSVLSSSGSVSYEIDLVAVSAIVALKWVQFKFRYHLRHVVGNLKIVWELFCLDGVLYLLCHFVLNWNLSWGFHFKTALKICLLGGLSLWVVLVEG